MPQEGNGMKNILFIFAVCAILIFSSLGKATFAGSLRIVVPPDNTYVESDLISVVLKDWPTMVDEITISVNGKKQALPAGPFNRYVACYGGIYLSYGRNKITVTALKKGKVIEELTRQVFYRSDLSANAAGAPASFKQYFFHTPGNEGGCSQCHNLDFRKAGEPEAPDQSPCYKCHKKIMSEYKFAHGPSAVWSCLLCHDGKSRERKLAAAAPIDGKCFNCHENAWEKKKYRHGPTAAGACTICHNPHGANRPNFLRMAPQDLCPSCHGEILQQPHVVMGFSGKGHPLYLSPNPLNRNRDLTCVSCHNPHGEDSDVFLNGYDESKSQKRFCTTCHRS